MNFVGGGGGGESMSLKEMKACLIAHGVSFHGFVEKSEFRRACADVRAAAEAAAAAPTAAPTVDAPRPQLPATRPAAIRNRPGHWDVFIGHSRRSAAAVVLASETATALEKRGLSVWFDVRMDDRSTAAMEQGVKNSKRFVAVVSGPEVNNDRPDDPPTGNAYFRREYCIKELQWAVDAGVQIQPIVRMEDKGRIGEFLGLLDEPLLLDGALQDVSRLKRRLGETDWIELNRNDREYWELGMTKLHRALGLTASEEGDGRGVPAGRKLEERRQREALVGGPPATTLGELLAPYGGRAPPPPDGCRYHFYLVKHEKFKYQALAVAAALQDELGFSVWLSQWEGQARPGATSTSRPCSAGSESRPPFSSSSRPGFSKSTANGAPTPSSSTASTCGPRRARASRPRAA